MLSSQMVLERTRWNSLMWYKLPIATLSLVLMITAGSTCLAQPNQTGFDVHYYQRWIHYTIAKAFADTAQEERAEIQDLIGNPPYWYRGGALDSVFARLADSMGQFQPRLIVDGELPIESGGYVVMMAENGDSALAASIRFGEASRVMTMTVRRFAKKTLDSLTNVLIDSCGFRFLPHSLKNRYDDGGLSFHTLIDDGRMYTKILNDFPFTPRDIHGDWICLYNVEHWLGVWLKR